MMTDVGTEVGEQQEELEEEEDDVDVWIPIGGQEYRLKEECEDVWSRRREALRSGGSGSFLLFLTRMTGGV